MECRYVDSEGSRVRGDLFAVGSGGAYAYAVLDAAAAAAGAADDGDGDGAGGRGGLEALGAVTSEWLRHPLLMSHVIAIGGLQALGAERAVAVAIEALAASTARDAFSGGFINVICVPAGAAARYGWRHLLCHDLGRDRKERDEYYYGEDRGEGGGRGDGGGAEGEEHDESDENEETEEREAKKEEKGSVSERPPRAPRAAAAPLGRPSSAVAGASSSSNAARRARPGPSSARGRGVTMRELAARLARDALASEPDLTRPAV
jgi:hypothetical protein